MADILLTTLNARYQHASLGLRYLLANLGELAPRAALLEFTLGARPEDVVERLLAERPRIVGLGVYIWNVEQSTRVVALLRRLAPDVKVVVGGPEVSHEVAEQRICALADHVITGPGDLAFARLARQLLQAEGWGAGAAAQPHALAPAPPHVIAGEAPDLDRLALPYALYTETDLRERFLYVEASRGCPFRCEFCLSALDRTAVPFDADRLLSELAALHARGARHFRFVDRTFNLKSSTSLALLEFFLARVRAAPEDPLFAHFELVPDHLPERLREAIRGFPPGTLQLEIGIQTWNPEVQALISRRQDNGRAEANLAWLAAETHAHLHVDLIAGLPGEDLESFGRGFDRLVALRPHEIQVGILKRLRGAPIARHAGAYGLRFNPDPPYNVLATDRIAFAEMQRVARFARYWDLIGNSGRFRRTRELILGDAPFARFMQLSDWLHARVGATHGLAAERQFELAREWLRERAGADPAAVDDAVAADYAASGAHGRPAFLARGRSAAAAGPAPSATAAVPRRQARHAPSPGTAPC